MMRGCRLPFALVTVLAVQATARAVPTDLTFQVRTTGDLVELCSAAPADPLAVAAGNFCVGFAVGVYAVLKEVEDAHGAKRLFCPPDPPPTRPQAIAAFLQWAKDNPGQLSLPPADGVYAFLTWRFPCAATP
jgi:hypothetical protein